ncbi:outer membrane autotransporter barrel domain-containing protein [Pragia fontium]|uniref:Outer membrane autotransporter barrel domain-containing protein n=1 Tax=Pragia fontium TaxID=82985 RepID=A0ABQ5LDT9_9GAMM|nr:autotransporter outer membrane beta-barrel domain-containing protein [Pragia fontium]GKX61489.1 outer membrane autotransporter barrel domain-containing protein [Pragia fontium]
MDISIYHRELQGKPTSKFCRRALNQRLAMAGLLSLSAMVFQQHALAAELGSQNADIITLNDGDKITADLRNNGQLYGVSDNFRTANINLADDVSITITENNTNTAPRGVIVQGKNSVLTANRLSVDVAGGGGGFGLDIWGNNTKVDLGTGSYIKVNSNGTLFTKGIFVGSASTLLANGLTIETNKGFGLDIQHQGTSVNLGEGSLISVEEGVGVDISGTGISSNDKYGPSRFEATRLTINAKLRGIAINKNAIVDLGSDSIINVTGDGAEGIYILANGEVKADRLTVKTTGNQGATALSVNSMGIANIGAGSHMSSLKSDPVVAFNKGSGKATINFSGTSEQRNTIFSGGLYGVSAQFNSVINLSNTDISVDRGGALGLGLSVMGGGVITGDNLTINGAAGARGVYTMSDSQIDLSGETIIHMADPAAIAIATQHNDGYSASRINAGGKMDIVGSILSQGGLITIDMQSGSQWSGGASSDNVNDGFLNIAMANSRWNMTADSNLDKLVLNNSTVDFSEDKVGSLLTIGELSGNGHFILRTDLVSDGVNAIGDKLVVSGKSEGNHQLTVLNRGSLATTGNEILTVVETQDGQAKFTSTSEVELGGYLYAVRQNGTHWELYSPGVYVPPPPEPEPQPNPDPEPIPEPEPQPNPSITTSADAGANFLNIGYLLNYAESQTLFQRMGDLRQTGKSGDMWLRGFAGKFDSFAGGKLSRFDMNYDGMQLGADKQVTEQLPVFMGIFTGLTKGSPNYASGDGTVKSHHFGVYGTYIAENGFYLDGMVKYSRLKNDFSVRDSQNNRVSGNGSSDGLSFSLETGQKLSLGQQGNGFYIEPQAQLSYSHQDATRVNASNGLKVDLGSYESLIGRGSAVVGYELQQGDNSLNVYLKTGYLREFSGDTDYRLNGSPESHSFKGGWWNNGVGVSAQMNQQHTLYLDLDTSTGNKFNQRQINAGYRFSF